MKIPMLCVVEDYTYLFVKSIQVFSSVVCVVVTVCNRLIKYLLSLRNSLVIAVERVFQNQFTEKYI